MTEAKVSTRKVMQMHHSLFITLPPAFIKEYEIKKGDRVAVVYNGQLRVIPNDVVRVRA